MLKNNQKTPYFPPEEKQIEYDFLRKIKDCLEKDTKHITDLQQKIIPKLSYSVDYEVIQKYLDHKQDFIAVKKETKTYLKTQIIPQISDYQTLIY